jgi:hypothetical protein
MAVINHLELVPVANELRPTGDDDIVVWQKYAVYYYGLDPSVKVVPHTTNLATRTNPVSDLMIDYRRTAGLGATAEGPIDDAYLNTLGAQQDLDLAFVEWERRLSKDATHPWGAFGPLNGYDDVNRAYPVYYNAATNSIQSMTPRDFMDTFIYPAMDKFFNATLSREDYVWRAGEYFISTSNSTQNRYFTGNGTFFGSDTRVNQIFEPVFADTIADRFAYTADGLIEERDQGTSETWYHLRVIDPILPPEIPFLPLYLDSDGNLQQYTLDEFVTLLGEHFKWQAAYGTDYTPKADGFPDPNYNGKYCIQYKIEQLYSGTISFLGNNSTDLQYTKKVHRGTTMYNTSRNFDDYTFLSKEFGADDYRAQRVPGNFTPELKQEYRMFIINNESP